MQPIFLKIIVVWPAVSLSLAYFFYQKQNSAKAWKGGPISIPKAMWLAYTVTNWFFLPIWFLMSGALWPDLQVFYFFHLASWWVRGSLELVMIYKWLNWSPRYGISHDLFHLLIGGTLFYRALISLDWSSSTPNARAAFILAAVILIATCAEIYFAYLFFETRTDQERDENVYFASDDPKWIYINRVTLSVVIPVYTHLIWQSYYLM